MDLFLQRCFDGFFNGAIYASLALALVMLFRSAGLLNFALGEIGLLGGYTSLVLFTTAGGASGAGAFARPIAGTSFASTLPGHPYPLPVAVVLGVLTGALLGIIIERVVMRRLATKPEFIKINATIALLLALSALIAEIWGGLPIRYPSIFPDEPDDYIGVAGSRLRYTTLGAWGLQLGSFALLWMLLHRTRIGLAFRAVTSNRESARLAGVPVGRTLSIGWATASAIGTLAAVLVASATVLRPGMMVTVLILAFAAATIGGLDSPIGAIVGGLVVGLTQSLVPGYTGFPSELAVVPPFLVMTVLLMFRPQGLFGTKAVARV